MSSQPGRDAVNHAYSVSRAFGEETVCEMCRLCQDEKVDAHGRRFLVPPWWQWPTWLAGALIIERNRIKFSRPEPLPKRQPALVLPKRLPYKDRP